MLSLTAAGWAIYKIEATPEGGGLPYLLFWTPLFLGISVVLLTTSFLLGKGPPLKHSPEGPGSPKTKPTDTSSKLNAWVTALLGAGVLALLVEAVSICCEGKLVQAVELVVLSAGVVAFSIWKGRLAPQLKRAINLLTIAFLIGLGLAWWWILDLILAVFDR
jgi:hypothetical protein